MDKVREFVKLYFATHRVYHSQMYSEVVHSIEKLAGASFRLFAEKPRDEQTNILARVTALSEKVNEALGKEGPLIVAPTLLSAIRVHEQLCNGACSGLSCF